MTQTKTPEADSTPRWSEWATRSTAVLAILAALSSGRWGASNLQAILEQGKVNDSWAWYQADSIKAHGAAEMAQLVKGLNHDLPSDRSKELAALEAKFRAESKDKENDKATRRTSANFYETSRDHMVERGFWYELSFAALQLAVILCTIATGAKRLGPWLFAIAVGILGLAILINGFHPFFRAPESWWQSTSQNIAGDSTPPATKPATP